MKARNQHQQQDDNTLLQQEVRSDTIRFDRQLATPDGQRWLDAEIQESLSRRCASCRE